MPTQTCLGPTGVDTGTLSKRRCATQLPGDIVTARRVRSQSAGCIHSRELIVSPVLHMALFSSQPSSLHQGAFRGSRVSGSNARHADNEVESFSQTSGKRLLSEITESAGLATRVRPLRKKYFQPHFSGNRDSHSA